MCAAYFAPFILLGAVPVLFYFVGPASSIGTVAGLLIFLLISELALPGRTTRPPKPGPRGYRLVPILYVPAQLAAIVWAILVADQLSPLQFAALALTIGVLTGVFGTLAAHEMVHSSRNWQRTLGALMLAGMMYRHFRIAHVYIHHRWAATEKDPATARLSEGFYAYFGRAPRQQFAAALAFERQRCRSTRFGFFRNRVHQDIVVVLFSCLAARFLAGAPGLAFYAAESAVAIVVLEVFNYVAHYGLLRVNGAEGGFGPPTDRHSWNSSNSVANTLIFNVGRHSDHHRRPGTPYECLESSEDAPELPLGYAGSILLALFPPLWRRVMDPRVLLIRQGS